MFHRRRRMYTMQICLLLETPHCSLYTQLNGFISCGHFCSYSHALSFLLVSFSTARILVLEVLQPPHHSYVPHIHGWALLFLFFLLIWSTHRSQKEPHLDRFWSSGGALLESLYGRFKEVYSCHCKKCRHKWPSGSPVLNFLWWASIIYLLCLYQRCASVFPKTETDEA